MIKDSILHLIKTSSMKLFSILAITGLTILVLLIKSNKVTDYSPITNYAEAMTQRSVDSTQHANDAANWLHSHNPK